MEQPKLHADPADAACPRCGERAHREETDVGVLLRCAACGFEAADPLLLDFEND